LISPRLWIILRFCAAALLVSLLAFTLRFSTHGGSVLAAPGFQSTQPYDAPPTQDQPDPGSGYDPPATSAPPANQPTSAATTGATSAPEASPTAEGTVTLTPTIPPDTFRTEDSEMNNSLTTPAVTETPGPSITPVTTQTALKTQSHATSVAAARKKSGFAFDWGLFWMGFSLPVLAACGMVLYLLDRRPDIFRPRKK
jgi:hypothetical protein